MTLKRLLSSLLTAVIIIAIPGIAMAGGGKGDKPDKGTVSAVDLKAKTITVTKKKSSESTTFKAADAKIMVEGAPGKLADITVGMHVSVTVGSAPDTAAEIDASAHKMGKHSTPPVPATPAPAAAATSGTTGA